MVPMVHQYSRICTAQRTALRRRSVRYALIRASTQPTSGREQFARLSLGGRSEETELGVTKLGPDSFIGIGSLSMVSALAHVCGDVDFVCEIQEKNLIFKQRVIND